MDEERAPARGGPESRDPAEVTALLLDWQAGDARALDAVIPLLYDELRAIAAGHLAREHGSRTLQPTALVHETWVRLIGSDPGRLESRAHFFATAAAAMRRILVEHARRRKAQKRGGDPVRVSLEGAVAHLEPDVLDVHRALDDLAEVAARQARLVELRFFGGLTLREAAEVLGLSLATAERDWRAAKHWLRRRLQSLEGALAADG